MSSHLFILRCFCLTVLGSRWNVLEEQKKSDQKPAKAKHLKLLQNSNQEESRTQQRMSAPRGQSGSCTLTVSFRSKLLNRHLSIRIVSSVPIKADALIKPFSPFNKGWRMRCLRCGCLICWSARKTDLCSRWDVLVTQLNLLVKYISCTFKKGEAIFHHTGFLFDILNNVSGIKIKC